MDTRGSGYSGIWILGNLDTREPGKASGSGVLPFCPAPRAGENPYHENLGENTSREFRRVLTVLSCPAFVTVKSDFVFSF